VRMPLETLGSWRIMIGITPYGKPTRNTRKSQSQRKPRARPLGNSSTHGALISHGYKLIEDAWEDCGRRTYLHDENATRAFIISLSEVLRKVGWETNTDVLRSFRHSGACEVIELEPGGSETTGHFLHHQRDFGDPGSS
jgi:hypothetical protein